MLSCYALHTLTPYLCHHPSFYASWKTNLALFSHLKISLSHRFWSHSHFEAPDEDLQLIHIKHSTYVQCERKKLFTIHLYCTRYKSIWEGEEKMTKEALKWHQIYFICAAVYILHARLKIPKLCHVYGFRRYAICGSHIICEEIYIWANLSSWRNFLDMRARENFTQSQAAMMRMLRELLQGVLCVHDVCMTALYWCMKLSTKRAIICWLKLRNISEFTSFLLSRLLSLNILIYVLWRFMEQSQWP
jgi:hypothetical protein